MRYGCIGAKLGHSFSPEIHKLIGGYDYELQEISERELGDYLRARAFCGINVTIPYKQAVIPYLDCLSEKSAAIGAVNTVVNRDGVLYGYNTDYYGMRSLILRMGLDLSGRKVLVLGTGGTSRTACAVSTDLGAAEVIPVSRSKNAGAVTYDVAYADHSDADVLINTTPCGMYPDLEGVPVDLARFRRLSAVVDAVFNPLSSRLVCQARQAGLTASGGLYMLVAQAAAASELFTGTPCEANTVERAYNELLRSKGNIVLIGMPGSGKSSVGQLIAARTGRPFVDLDAVVTQAAGKPVSAIFSQNGEAVFRDLESAAVRSAAARTGLVIATGGGCVLRKANTELLRMNGRLVFINRPLSDLLPSEDRPLSDSPEKLEKLYRYRLPIYGGAADVTIDARGSADEVADAVLARFLKESVR